MQVKVVGAAAKIDAIFRFDKAAWRDIQRGVKKATELITNDARGRVPPMGIVPLGGGRGWGPWNHFGRDFTYNQGAFKFRTKFQSRSKAGFRQVQGRSVLDTSNVAVAIFTLAGSENRSGHPFNTNINKQTGTRQGARGQGMWPRLLTPAYYAHGPTAAKTIGDLIQDAVAQVNRS